ncbi:unnamed protein product [Coregonus sp. 'balchen']|nr:unnamed protein product [Coregonus sp. 'balchen']
MYFSKLICTLFIIKHIAHVILAIKDPYSYSSAVGLGTGTPFASSGEGRITAVRVWENNNYYYYYYYYNNNAYINGFQLRYSNTWSPVFGGEVGEKQEMELFKDEAIVEVSGKYNPGDYICYLVFTTNRGRSLSAGQPYHVSFNFYTAHMGSELRLLNGQFNAIKDPYSYSSAVGLGTGTPFASSGEGRITAVRVWENNNYYYYYYYYYYNNNAYINGFQLRYSNTWSPVFGGEVGEKQEMELFKNEAIVEVSGKYNPGDYICYLVFTTNRGRSLSAGQPYHVSFNFYTTHMGSELRLLNGQFNGASITSI